MRLTTSLLALLPLTIAAQEQQNPLQSWLDKAKSYLPNAATAPVASAAGKAAASNVATITTDNWKSTLTPSTTDPADGPEPWMVFFTGGNKSCYGRCLGVEKAWNESTALLAADPSAPKLGFVHCDKSPVLCTMWATNVPSIWHVELPVVAADQSKPATTIRILVLNTTTTTAMDIVKIHTEKTYEKKAVYESPIHPFDGWFAQYGLIVPMGYILYGFANIPSWAFMIVISLMSRTIM